MPSLKRECMNINIETLIITAIETEKYLYQGLWTISKAKSKTKQFYFYQCSSEFKPDSPHDLSIDELFCFNNTDLLRAKTKLTQIDALYLLKYALLETIELMHSRPQRLTKIFSTDTPLDEMLERLVPDLNVEQLLTLPDEIGFAAAIDFSPKDEIGRNAAKLLISNTMLN